MICCKCACSPLSLTLIILLGTSLPPVFADAGGDCRDILFMEPMPNKVITGHVIRSLELPYKEECLVLCYWEPDCASINFRPSYGEKYKCELNNATANIDQLNFLQEIADSYYQAIENPCDSNPCSNGGTCQAGFTNRGFRCVCPAGLPGINCEGKSCSEVKTLDPTSETGPYVIDPDGEGGLMPYNVTCDMNDKNGVGVTVISHDSENRTLVDGCDPVGCYSREVNYIEASFSQLASLTRVSLHCEQHFKFECLHVRMYRNRNFAWWLSRDSKEMTYWNGSVFSPHKCACGMDNSCQQRLDNTRVKNYCNCDMNDDIWREDTGLLTNKSHLPVKQLKFGDTGTSRNNINEHGYHTLGKFKCYGQV